MKKRIINIVLILIFCLIVFLGYFYLNNKYGFSINCFFHELTGFYCPGCGITRCLFSLLKLDFYEAFMYNQLVFIMLPFLVILFCYKIYLYIFDKQDKILKKVPIVVWILLLVIAVGFGIIRNISYFDFLRP